MQTFIFFLLNFVYPSPEKINLKTIPREWVKLSKIEDEYVIFNSCDAGNLLLSTSVQNDRYKLLLHGQQEDFEYNVIDQKLIQNDTLVVTTTWYTLKATQTFKFTWIDKQKQLAYWSIAAPNGSTVDEIFVSETQINNYRTFEQPCKECWDDCE